MKLLNLNKDATGSAIWNGVRFATVFISKINSKIHPEQLQLIS